MPNILIIGSGPAGLFAARELIKNPNNQVTVIEGGSRMESRKCPETKNCNCKSCAVLEGAGGAGGLSDGKNTYSTSRGTGTKKSFFKPEDEKYFSDIDGAMIKHAHGRLEVHLGEQTIPEYKETQFTLETYRLRHFGSDGIQKFIIGFVKELEDAGVKFHFNMDAVSVTGTGKDKTVYCQSRDQKHCFLQYKPDVLMIGSGIQGFPWLKKVLSNYGVPLLSGSAGFGIRFESDQENLRPLFDTFYDFKLTYKYKKLSYRSFCCNDRGWITNENHRTLGVKNVNGHSYLDPKMRSGRSNFSIQCMVGADSVQDPQEYVAWLGKRCNDAVAQMTDGATATGVQKVSDFLNYKSTSPEYISPYHKQSRGGVNLHSVDTEMAEGFRKFILELGLLADIHSGNALIYYPEIKYFAERLDVDTDTFLLKGTDIHIIGHATGHLDSFVACAVSGIKAAQKYK